MIVVRCHGGIGNQMFQYAMYVSAKARGFEARLDIDEYDYDYRRCFELADAFDLDFQRFLYPRAARALRRKAWRIRERWQRPSLPYYAAGACNRIARVIGPPIEDYMVRIDDRGPFEWGMVPDDRDVLLDGYWQSSRYFADAAKAVREAYRFRVAAADPCTGYLRSIKASESVSIHVRRGDYVSDPVFRAIYGGICTEDYYRQAIRHMQSVLNKPRFFVVSDDVGWVSSSFLVGLMEDFEIVDTRGAPGWCDMMIMSACKHHIMANSSFSWWSSWLGDEGLVVAPSPWVNPEAAGDLGGLDQVYEDGWKLIDPQGRPVS